MDLLRPERWFPPSLEAAGALVEAEIVDGRHDDEPTR
jgi:hypothetical protein